MVVRKQKYFVDGKCVLCATEECNDFCHHYGAVVCRKTLKKMGEALYLKGQDELGIKFYSRALYAEQSQGVNKTPIRIAPRTVAPIANSKRIESIEARAQRKNAIYDELKRKGLVGRLGVFGVFSPRPINHTAAVTFYRDHNG